MLFCVVRWQKGRDAVVRVSDWDCKWLIHVHGDPKDPCKYLPERRACVRAHAVWHRVGEERALCAWMHGVRIRLAQRTAISMAPPQLPAPRIRTAYVSGERQLSHFTHSRSGSPPMGVSGCDSMKSAIACRSCSGSDLLLSARL